MCSETTQESAFLLEEHILEFNGGGKVVLVKEGAARIDFPTVFVVVSPETSWPVILQGETERVDGPVTGRAISPLAMFIGPLSLDLRHISAHAGNLLTRRHALCKQGRFR